MVLPCLRAEAAHLIGGSCFGWIGERIRAEAAHLIAYGDNIENLRKQVQDLSDAIESVEDRIREAENSRGATRVDAVVDRLLERMATLREDASKIITDEERSSDCTCIIRLRPNLWACYLTSKSAKKAIDEAAELLEKEKNLDRAVSNVDYSGCLGVTPIPNFEEFESRVLVSNQIVAALKDPDVNKVGVYGMGGTGKTTLAEKIGAELQLDGTFSYVVLATVSEKQSLLENNYQSDLISIQRQIAGGLKIQLQGETLSDRARQLCEQLQKRDKLLIILDDIWSKFELEKVGIPIGNNKFTTTFKILMTSRSKMVLENEMDSTNNFGLNSLPPSDAQNVFDKMVGGNTQYSNWRLTAQEVVDQCGGIPILLATTGRALRNVNQSIWEDALTQLKQFDGEDFDEEAYKRIEVSYKFLKNEETKKLFLLCAQLDHRSILFGELVKYTIGLDLFRGRKKVKEVSGRLHKYLQDLKGCCLLQDGTDEGIIKMHDVVHKFAVFVASRDNNVFSVANDGELEEWPSMEQFEKFTAISFFYCRLPSDHELPVVFDNSKLESFLMLRSEIDESFKVPDNLFAGMKRLKLLNLTRMSLTPVLVSSLNALVKLRTLCLDHCELGDVAVIGEFPMLQALSLAGSSIVCVPKEIGKLGSTLKLLDMHDCFSLESIASGVISKLTLLEDLRIGESSVTWERLEGNDKSVNSSDVTYDAEVASLEEFKNLRNLINLEIHISEHAKMFPKDLVFKNLETFRIFIGRYSSNTYYLLPRTLQVDESSTVVEFDNEGIKALMTRAESLSLIRVTSSVSVSEMDPKGFPGLKHLQVEYGDGIQYIVKKNYSNCIFPKLETFQLSGLFNLKRICDDHHHLLPLGSFENLTNLYVSRCDLLNDIFSSNLASSLLRLKGIGVDECESVKSIIVPGESENEEIKIGFTHQLQELSLQSLPCFVSFYRFKELEGLPSRTHLFNKKIMFPKLEVLELIYMKIEKIWDDHVAITAEGTCWIQNLTSLNVDGCDNLSYLFTSTMVQSLAQLKKLKVRNCESVEEIVSTTRKGEMKGEEFLLFPKLESLRLQNLSMLKRFCHANLLECQSLQTLKIEKCSLLKAFNGANESSLFDQKIVFPKLKELSLIGMEIEKIWDFDHLAIAAEETTCWFQNLISVEVNACNNLSHVFTSSMVKSFEQLKQLEVSVCDSVEEIVASSTERETTGDIQLLFPKLDNIKMMNLPNLKRFCQTNLLECQLLRSLDFYNCPKLKTFTSVNDSSSSDNPTSLFTEKAAFPNMEKLRIEDCESLEEVFDIQVLPCKVHPFQKLRSVVVSGCSSLTSIFPASLVPNLQQLKRLEIRYCAKIGFFGFKNTQQLNDAFAKLFSTLEYCFLGVGNGLSLKYEHQQFILKFVDSGLKVPPIFYVLLQSFPKLDEVEVSRSSVVQLFLCEPDHVVVAADCDPVRIGLLKLTELSSMKQIWSENYPLKYHGIPEVLEVAHCDSLLTLAPPSTTTLFKNLTCLTVFDCEKLSYLFTSLMVESLAKLKQLEVSNCKSIEEIVASSAERETTGAIQLSFPKLENIKLKDLPNLKEFCEANLLECQLLQKLVIQSCSKLKTFMSASDSSSDKIAFPNVEELVIYDCDSLEKVFDIQVSSMNECKILSFQKLRSVFVSQCASLTCIY